MLSEGLEPKTHKGVQTMLAMHFVKTGKLPAELNEVFVRAQAYREAADYTRGFAPTPAEFSRNLDDARRFIDACRDVLSRDGWFA